MSDAISKILGLRDSRLRIHRQIREFTVLLIKREFASAVSGTDAAKRIGLSYRALRRIIEAYPDELGADYDAAVIDKHRKNEG